MRKIGEIRELKKRNKNPRIQGFGNRRINECKNVNKKIRIKVIHYRQIAREMINRPVFFTFFRFSITRQHVLEIDRFQSFSPLKISNESLSVKPFEPSPFEKDLVDTWGSSSRAGRLFRKSDSCRCFHRETTISPALVLLHGVGNKATLDRIYYLPLPTGRSYIIINRPESYMKRNIKFIPSID